MKMLGLILLVLGIRANAQTVVIDNGDEVHTSDGTTYIRSDNHIYGSDGTTIIQNDEKSYITNEYDEEKNDKNIQK